MRTLMTITCSTAYLSNDISLDSEHMHTTSILNNIGVEPILDLNQSTALQIMNTAQTCIASTVVALTHPLVE